MYVSVLRRPEKKMEREEKKKKKKRGIYEQLLVCKKNEISFVFTLGL